MAEKQTTSSKAAAEKPVPDVDEPKTKASAAKGQEEPVAVATVVGQTAQEPIIFDPTNPEELADPANLPAKPDDVDEQDHGRTTSS